MNRTEVNRRVSYRPIQDHELQAWARAGDYHRRRADQLCGTPAARHIDEPGAAERAAAWLRAAELPARFRLDAARVVVDSERWRARTLACLAAGGRMAGAALDDVRIVYLLTPAEAGPA